MANKLIVISGPSGVGKGTIVNGLLKKGGYALSISCTTRAPRKGEREGISYFFIDTPRFLSGIASGAFLEYANHFGNFYGTPKRFVEERLKEKNVILEIDVDGALQVKKSYPDALLFMILPPSLEELKKRLSGRGTEDSEEIQNRLQRIDYELSKQPQYDYSIVNDSLEEAIAEIDAIIKEK